MGAPAVEYGTHRAAAQRRITGANSSPSSEPRPSEPRPASPSSPLLRHTLHICTRGAVSRNSSIDPRWRRELANPRSLYALSCATYAIGGLLWALQLAACPESVPYWASKIGPYEAALVTLQSVCSFWSDVLMVGRPSYAHAVDRCSALTLTALQPAKFLLLTPHVSHAELAWIWGGILVGVGFKVAGYRAIINDDVDAFRRMHILWHVSLPLALSAWAVARWRDGWLAGVCG